MTDATDWTHARPARVTVRLWRCVAGVPQGLFTFAGAADARVLAAIMQHVRALTHALPDWWRLEVITVDFDRALLSDVGAMLREIQRGGPATRWAHAPESAAELRVRSGRAAQPTVELMH